MLAATTSVGTIIAGVSLAIMFIPIYVMTLKGAQAYGRLEQKVDGIAALQVVQQSAAVAESAATLTLFTALTVRVEQLADKFNLHTEQDAANFGEIKGILHSPIQPERLPN